MPEQNDRPRLRYQTLNKAHEVGQLVRAQCANCYIKRYYLPADLITILGRGDVPYWAIEHQMRCERCRRKEIVIDVVFLSAAERMTIRVRRLAEIRMVRKIIWRDEGPTDPGRS